MDFKSIQTLYTLKYQHPMIVHINFEHEFTKIVVFQLIKWLDLCINLIYIMRSKSLCKKFQNVRSRQSTKTNNPVGAHTGYHIRTYGIFGGSSIDDSCRSSIKYEKGFILCPTRGIVHKALDKVVSCMIKNYYLTL